MFRRKCDHKSEGKTAWTGTVHCSSQFSSQYCHKDKKHTCGSGNYNSVRKRNEKDTKRYRPDCQLMKICLSPLEQQNSSRFKPPEEITSL